MKKKLFFPKTIGIVITSILLSLQLDAQVASGTYTIGGTSPDYLSIQAAVDTLENQGVLGDGHVVFNIADGNYYEQVFINDIAKTSATSTVTFQSASADSTKVAIMHATTGSSNNYVLNLKDCDYVIFKQVRIYNYGTNSYSRVVTLDGHAKNNSFENCEIIGYSVSGTTSANSALLYSYGDNVDTLKVNQCNFQDGSWGISINGNGVVSEGMVITNNIISSLGGIYLNDQDRTIIKHNTITTSFYTGIDLHECDFNTIVSYNYIDVNTTYSANLAGIFFDACDGNVVDVGLIANNSISVSGNSSYNTSPISLSASDNHRIFNNSCHLINAKSNTGVLYVGGGSKIELLNNNFVNSSLGYAMLIDDSGVIFSSDYNNLYTGGNYLVHWGQNVYDLEDLKALAGGMDDNSTSYFPSFVSNTNLRPQTNWLNGTGTTSNQTDVPDDITGVARDVAKPDVGAFEFTPNQTSTYSGTLTIAPTAADFTTFNEAIDSLELFGISGPVTLEFADGTYSERVFIHEIPGASPANRITVTSASADSSKVSLIYSTVDTDVSAFVFVGTDYFTFKHLKLGNSSTTAKGRVVLLEGYAHDLIFENNIFTGAGAGYNTEDRTIIYSNGYQPHNLTIQNNSFSGGSRHISLLGIDATPDVLVDNVIIKNNIFDNSYTNINLIRASNVLIEGNQINDFQYAGIYLNTCENPLDIKNNTLQSVSSDDFSIRVEACYGVLGGEISNNFITISNAYSIYGLSMLSSQYFDIYFNSINTNGAHADNGALYLSGNSTLNIKNNIFASSGNGFAIYSADVPNNVVLNFNDLFSSGANLVKWGTFTYSSLVDYQTEALQGANSVNVNPGFVSETDLHSNSYWLDNAGIAIVGITTDIDGDDRSDPPCIGADEYITTLSPLAGPYEIGSGGDYATITDAVNALAENGISGNVEFKIITGTYNEQFKIPQIFIINETDSIVFTSKSGVAEDVKISYEGTSADNNYIAKLDGADRITFKNLSFLAEDSEFSHCIALSGNLNRIYIQNCEFQGRSTASTTTNDAIIYVYDNAPYINTMLIDSCSFVNGSWGIYVYAGSISNPIDGLVITNNNLNNSYKNMYIRNVEGAVISNNTMVFNAEQGYGIKLYDSKSGTINPTIIIKNQVYSDFKTNEGGIVLDDSDGLGAQPVILANNVVQTSKHGSYESYGIKLHDTDNVNVYYNSVNITGNNLNDRAFFNDNSDNINIYNNSFAIRGGVGNNYIGSGYAIDILSGTNITGDYNNFYTPGRFIGKWMNVSYKTLNDFKSASSSFDNSIFVFPAYEAYNNLQSVSDFLNASAIPYAGISDDINGVIRDASTPDIGAYEILNPDVPIAAGAYTVGSGGNFLTIDSMCTTLMKKGITGTVTFNIMDGIYENVHFMFRDIPGVSANDSVIIQSQALDSTKVTLGYEQTVGNNFIFYLNGTDYLTLKHLSLTSAGTGYSQLIVMYGNVNNISILNNRLNGYNTNTYNVEQTSIQLYGDCVADNLYIKNNIFNYNSYGIYLNGYPNYTNQNIVIEGNTMLNQYYSIYLYEINNPRVLYNTITAAQSKGIYLYYCLDAVEILGNQLATDYNANAIHVSYTTSSGVVPGLVANNFVQTNGEYGIHIDHSAYQNIYYNTINQTGNNAGSAFRTYYSNNIKVINNIFNASGTAYAYYNKNGNEVIASDYNNLNTSGTRFAYYANTAYDTLPDFQSASLMDDNSFQVEPLFMSKSDLHLLSFDLMEQATVLEEITSDVDGELRDAIKPDIGADEIYARPPLADSKTICEGEPTPTLSALGINVKWYDDEALTNLIWSANDFSPGVATPGVYTYYVTQTIGDDVSDPTIVTLTIIAAPLIEGVLVNIDCQGNDYGGVNLSVTSDNGPFFYRWSNEATTEDITNLLAGKYYVTVEDIVGCTSTDSFVITAPNPIELTMIVSDADCGETNGSATVFAEGGIEPYTYTWTSGDSVAVTNNLASGIYIVTVTDDNGCSESSIANVNDLGGSIIDIDAVNDVSCYGGNDGSIAITISGGVTPYKTQWSNGATTQDINNLVAGPYEVTITDADTCRSVQSIKVNQPDPIFIGLGVFDSNCGQANGSAETQVTGGVSPYTYNWSTGASVSEIADLGLGVYDVTITDANSCQAVKSFAVSEAGAPVVYVDSIIEGTCGDNNGAIYITAYGGVGLTYSYLWSTSATDEDLIGLNPGEYAVTVSDSLGCSGAAVAEIVAEKPATPSICIVTVDTATNHNEIIWTKPVTTDIDYYNIYKESTQKDVYLLVDKVNYSDESIYVDLHSNAVVKSDRYKISAVNNCGVESDLSAHHKTMHLTIVPGNTSSSKVLRWDHYEGFYISTYYIYRQTEGADWIAYDSIQSNLTSYTDIDVPVGNVTYFIEIKHPTGCDITKAGNRNSSRSNTKSTINNPSLSDKAEIVKFTLAEQLSEASINTEAATVLVVVANGTDLGALTPTIEVSTDASVSPKSGVAMDFGNPVVYTVTAASGFTKNWTATVIEESSALFDVSFTVSSGTGVLSGAEVSFGGNVQTTDASGITVFVDQAIGSDLPYTVSKTGFNDFSGSVTISSADVNVDVLLTPIGIENSIQNSLLVYPNPNKGSFYLYYESDKMQALSYSIYNKQGSKIMSKQIPNAIGKVYDEINLQDVAKGVYFIQIVNDEFITYKKIIIK